MLQFDERTIINLNGSGLTLENLELIVQVANEHGAVTLTNVGSTSFLDLAMAMLAWAERYRKEGAA